MLYNHTGSDAITVTIIPVQEKSLHYFTWSAFSISYNKIVR